MGSGGWAAMAGWAAVAGTWWAHPAGGTSGQASGRGEAEARHGVVGCVAEFGPGARVLATQLKGGPQDYINQKIMQ